MGTTARHSDTSWGRNQPPVTWVTVLVALYMVLALSAAFTAVPSAGVVLIAGLGLLIGLVWASASVNSQGHLRAVSRVENSGQRVALTFDDGPDPDTTPIVLDLLKSHGAKATFFVIGARAKEHPEILRRMIKEGHEVANHGFKHHWTTLLTPARARSTITAGATAITASGAPDPTWYRPAHGIATPALGAVARKLDLAVAGWDVRSFDASPVADPKRCLQRIERGVKPGSIVLLHDAPEARTRVMPRGPTILPRILQLLQERELEAVTLTELVEGKPPTGAPATH